MAKETHTIVYNVSSFPIIFTFSPASLDSSILLQFPRLAKGEVQYSPEYKSISLGSIEDVKLNPNVSEYGISGNYREQIEVPVIASLLKTDNTAKTHAIRQRNFEEQVMRSPSDATRYRRIYTNVGIHMVKPLETGLDLEPFMVISNGVSDYPLIIRNIVSRSFQTSVYKVSGIILEYLFGE
ncbi:hypothetical protein [Acinetobacter sp.]|uniref:hypothetical protein n=1 Tax=Acinetobacter sp. TaxID=472 RepID=UPI003D084E84